MRFTDAIATQGENLRQSRRVVEAALRRIDLTPWRTGRLGVTGIGASSHAAASMVAAVRAIGRPALALPVEELAAARHPELADCIIAVTQEGTSTETLDALRAARDLYPMVVTNAEDSPAARLAEAVIPLSLMEDSPVYTLGYTATLQALGLLTDTLAGEETGESWQELPAAVESLIVEAAAPLANILEHLDIPRAVDLVGSGSHVGAAGEGALLLREGARLPTSWHSTRQYLHGPMEAVEEGFLVVVLGDDREVSLAQELAGTGAEVLLLTAAKVEACPHLGVVRLPAFRLMQRAVLEIVPIQLLTARLASRLGLAVDGFRYQQADTKAPAGTSASVNRATHPPQVGGALRAGSIGIDIGGTKVAVALCSAGGATVERFEVEPTPRKASEVVVATAERLVGRALEAAARSQFDVAGIGVVVPEIVGLDGQILSNAVIPGLDAVEWSRRFGTAAPVGVESDVRAAAAAEAAHGAGRGCRSFCYVSVGTGISYSLVLDGRVHAGARGAAIQIGNSVAAEWEEAGTCRRWVLEEIAAGPALLERYKELGGEARGPEQIIEAYRAEETARRAVAEAARAFGIGVGLLVNLLDPELIVVGGGLGSADGPFFELFLESAREHIWLEAARWITIRRAELGPRSAAIGAAMVGLRASSSTPPTSRAVSG